jgi:nucleotide-binding universal stress UspA family protein
MNRFDSILLPLDGSPEAAKGANCAMWLAKTLGATLHVLHATAQPLPGHEALARLRFAAGEQSGVVLHQMPGNAATAVLKAIDAHAAALVVMSARGESASAGWDLNRRLGAVAQAVIERTPVPVLLLPMHYRETLPWTSMLAAASGEAAADQALDLAVRLAFALGLKVTVMHSEEAPLMPYADTLHYEYPRRIEQMAARGLAACDVEQCQTVDRFLLRRGDPASVLLQQVARQSSSVLALGCHGAFGRGRAHVLKQLLETAECALLLVRGPDGGGTRLKVGGEINE